MRIWLSLLVLGALFASGCAGKNRTGVTIPPGTMIITNTPNQKVIITPDRTLLGKVIRVNVPGRFVVVNFPIGRLPALEQRFDLYRRGLKVAEVKITGPQMDDNVVADLLTGEAQPGDEARQQ